MTTQSLLSLPESTMKRPNSRINISCHELCGLLLASTTCLTRALTLVNLVDLENKLDAMKQPC